MHSRHSGHSGHSGHTMKNAHTVQKYIIIGGGISGLYTAYKLLRANPSAKITLFEKNKYIGGRIRIAAFGNTHVPVGAGIARKAKDHLLLDLLDKFKLQYHTGVAESMHIGHTEINIEETVNKLRKKYLEHPVHEKFSIFAKKFMSSQIYELFVTNSGYSDYNNTDTYDVLFNYGIEDTYDGWTTVYVPWSDLITHLVKFIKDHGAKIKLNSPITNLKDLKIDTNNVNPKIIIATTLSHLQKLLHKSNISNISNIYKSIGATNFMRVYGVFSETSRQYIAEKIPKLTILNKPLQEIIPINPEKGVYMIVYNDNDSARKMYKEFSKLNNTSITITSNDVGENTPKYNNKCIAYLEKKLSNALELPLEQVQLNNIAVYYWNEGTHYYKPLNKKYTNRDQFIHSAQRPAPNIFVVGEVVAQHQGWSEGALQSVENIFSEL